MKDESMKNLTLIKNETLEKEFKETLETAPPKRDYQSNPLKTDLYARLSAFRKSQKKFTIKDVINDSLK